MQRDNDADAEAVALAQAPCAGAHIQLRAQAGTATIIAAMSWPPAQPLICPRCDQPLVRGQAVDMVMHACGRCGGIWLDLQGARRVRVRISESARRLAQMATDHGKSPVDRKPTIACLICKQPMRRSRFEPAGVDLDRCGQHGTWYDHAELLQMADAVHRLNALERTPRAASTGVASPVGLMPLLPGPSLAAAGDGQSDFIDTTVKVLRVADGAVDVVVSVMDIADATDTPEAVAGVFELAVALFEFL